MANVAVAIEAVGKDLIHVRCRPDDEFEVEVVCRPPDVSERLLADVTIVQSEEQWPQAVRHELIQHVSAVFAARHQGKAVDIGIHGLPDRFRDVSEISHRAEVSARLVFKQIECEAHAAHALIIENDAGVIGWDATLGATIDRAFAGPDYRRYGIGDTAVACQRRFDITKLYPRAANFYLMILSTEELDPAVGLEPRDIAAAIHAAFAGHGIWHERRRCLLVAVKITEC